MEASGFIECTGGCRGKRQLHKVETMKNITKTLRLKVQQIQGAVVVCAGGMADIATAQRMKLKLEQLAQQHLPVIILDLSNLKFICSVGLGAIIGAHVKCRHHQGEIRLVNPQPAVLGVLETTRLTQLFPIYQTVEDALQGQNPCHCAPLSSGMLQPPAGNAMYGAAGMPQAL